jgi:hypothetical protein
MGFFDWLTTIMIIALICAGGYNALQNNKDNPEVKAIANNISLEKAGSITCFALGYNSITPAFQKDWLPESIQPKGNLLYMIEDVPLPDTTDFIILGIVALITITILRYTIMRLEGISKWFIAIGILLAVMIVFWIIIKIVAYNMMTGCAHDLGVSKELALQIRQESINSANKTGLVWPIFIFSIFGVITFFKIAFSGGKKE